MRLYTTPWGTRCEIVETTEVVGDAGWRWSRVRADRFAAHMNRMVERPSYRYVVVAEGWGRWRVVAMQNRLRPLPADDQPARLSRRG